MSNAIQYELEQTLLTISNVSLALGGRAILEEVNASVRNIVRPGLSQGQVVAILGPSGIGKTQLFRILAGLKRPDSGKVLVGTAQTPVRPGQVGVVAQNYPLFEHYTVFENLLVAARALGAPRVRARELSQTLLQRFRLELQRDAYPAILSGGQRQRVAIAQQLFGGRELLLMDEPFSGLDPLMNREVCQLIRQVSELDEVFTIVVVTHDIEAALSVADTLWLIGRAGKHEAPARGASIAHSIDLIERGLAWREDVRSLPAFVETKREVESLFLSL